MDFTFACPHCGVITQIDSSYLGESGPCRACDVEVTVPFPDRLDETDCVVNELDDHDQAEARLDEQHEEWTRQLGARILRFAVVAVLVLLAGRAAMDMNWYRSRPSRSPKVELYRDATGNFNGRREFQPTQLREQIDRKIREEAYDVEIEELLKSGKVFRYSPNESPLNTPPQ